MYAVWASVVFSLWQLNDQAIAQLMKELYKQILTGFYYGERFYRFPAT
jgi:hypothetical protein